MAYERQKLKNELKINLNYGEIGGKINCKIHETKKTAISSRFGN